MLILLVRHFLCVCVSMSATITNLSDVRHEREAAPSRLIVVRDESPDSPNVSYYSLMGTSFQVVQGHINCLMAGVEAFGPGGTGSFDIPKEVGDGEWCARGRIEVFPDV
jgi:hypothetical protein